MSSMTRVERTSALETNKVWNSVASLPLSSYVTLRKEYKLCEAEFPYHEMDMTPLNDSCDIKCLWQLNKMRHAESLVECQTHNRHPTNASPPAMHFYDIALP